MPGVIRPTTLVDVLWTLNQQSSQTAGSFTGLAAFAETDEATTLADSWTSSTQTNPTWDNGEWGSFTWG